LLQDDLEQARDAADAANQAKSEFLANMSHELRTPMNAILGYSEMLVEEAEDLGQENFIPDLNKINKAGTHLLSLINDVLDLAKIESGKMEAFPEEISLDNLIDDVSATAHPLMEKNNNKLSIERGSDLGTAWQDLTKLRQTLFNLLSNAAKFTHDGTITLHVHRMGKDGIDWLTLAVSDTGIGIAADKIDHVFEEFSQADGSTTRDYGGTGLGLAISRRFCQLLGGDLTLHSELGEGSTFTASIPATLPGKTLPATLADVKTGETGIEVPAAAVAGDTILVIDDDPEALEIIERFLVKDGFNVVTAGTGEQGLCLARECQPVAITLDVMMPGMDGWSVLRLLKADPELHRIPVIMLTMIDDRTRGYSLGAVDYLTKPVDRELLHKTLSRYHCADAVCPVLLVEDDIATRTLMAQTLEKAGWTVSEAGNGQEALDMMPDVQPRLILLDLMMPVMDGFGFLAAMRARPEWRHIPVIVITAKDLTADDRARLAGNVEEVLEKTAYTREQLLEHVRDAVAACNISDQSG
jgi:CheY-like chemotaxis protein